MLDLTTEQSALAQSAIVQLQFAIGLMDGDTRSMIDAAHSLGRAEQALKDSDHPKLKGFWMSLYKPRTDFISHHDSREVVAGIQAEIETITERLRRAVQPMVFVMSTINGDIRRVPLSCLSEHDQEQLELHGEFLDRDNRLYLRWWTEDDKTSMELVSE